MTVAIAIGTPGVFTIQEAMKELQVCRRTIYYLVEKKVLTYLRDEKTGRMIFSSGGLKRVRAWQAEQREKRIARFRQVALEWGQWRRQRAAAKRGVITFISLSDCYSAGKAGSLEALEDFKQLFATKTEVLENALARNTLAVGMFNPQADNPVEDIHKRIHNYMKNAVTKHSIKKRDHLYYYIDPRIDKKIVKASGILNSKYFKPLEQLIPLQVDATETLHSFR